MLELQRESVERHGHSKGTYDVYDCAGAGSRQLVMHLLRVLARITADGEKHYPENICACYVINPFPALVHPSVPWSGATP